MKKTTLRILLICIPVLLIIAAGGFFLLRRPSEDVPPESVQTSDTSAEETVPENEPEPLVFNPHLYSPTAATTTEDDWWQAFYNFVDAARAGEDSFECSSQEAFDWATNEFVRGELFPYSVENIKADSFADGIGHFHYEIPAEDFVRGEAEFEAHMTEVLNEVFRSDYSDVEKCLAVYDYVTRNYMYNFDNSQSLDGKDMTEFGTYACLMNQRGICTEICSAVSYLLLQSGVDALHAASFGCPGGDHAWTYVICDGQGYYIDATFGLTYGIEGFLPELRYFMQTTEDRNEDGFYPEATEYALMDAMLPDYTYNRFTCDDDRFAPLHEGLLVSMDTEKNIIYYQVGDDVREFSYED